jgi:hypothetical protein
MPETPPDGALTEPRLSRRQLVRLGLALPLPYLLAACGRSDEASGPTATTSQPTATTGAAAGGTTGASLTPTPS